MLAMTSAAFAGSAVNQLGSAVGVTAADTSVQAPSAPEAPVNADNGTDEKSFCHRHHNNLPGCAGYCRKYPMAPTCRPPAYCHTNPSGYGCPKSADDKSIDAADESFDEGLAKANCTTNPGAPGCPLFCKDHHAYPGCPMYCQLNPLSPACGHVPAYCQTNPNGYGCQKGLDMGAEEEATAADEVTAADEADAKGRCHDHHNNLPGCPGYCSNPQHQQTAACALPFHCRNNMQLHACKMYCVQYPKAQGCKKSADDKSMNAGDELFDPELAKVNCANNPASPGCPLYCSHHHTYPGCPMYCQLNPMSPACGHIPEYCHTNPNGYNCPKQ
jgi:hypothetical protein